jgi:hypothetical protein
MGVDGGYNLGTLLLDALTVLAPNHTSTSDAPTAYLRPVSLTGSAALVCSPGGERDVVSPASIPGGRQEHRLGGGSPVVKKVPERAGFTSKRAPKSKKPPINEEEEQILSKAAIYCLHTFPMLWTVGGI